MDFFFKENDDFTYLVKHLFDYDQQLIVLMMDFLHLTIQEVFEIHF